MRIRLWYEVVAVVAMLAPFAIPARDAAAGAFLMREQSARASGRAFAGEAAIAEDASTIFYNPAGMTELSGPQVMAGGYVVKPEAKLSDRGSTVNGVAVGGDPSEQGFDAQPMSHFYVAAPATEDLWLGLAVTVPFGLRTKYKSDYFGRYDSIEARIVTIDVAPSVAYAVTSRLSIGGGVDLQYIDAKLVNALPNPFFPGDPSADGKQTVKGDDISVGYNLGVLYQATEALSLGATYRAAVSHKLAGTSITEFGGTTTQHVEANIDLPDIFSLAAAYRLTPAVTLLGQANYYTWSRYDQIHFDFADGSRATLEEQYGNSWGASLGAQFAVGGWTLRTGLEYDRTPTRDPTRSTAVPDADRIWLGIGASYEIARSVVLDLSYAHMFAKDEEINRTSSFPALGTTATTRGATETSADVFGFSLRVDL